MALPTVLVTEQEYRRAERVFASTPGMHCVPAPAEESALADAIESAGARYAVVGPLHYRDALYTAVPRGGVLARFGVGHDGIDKAAATRAGVLCTNTPGVLDQSVAEHTLLLITAAARHIVPLAQGMQQQAWAPLGGMELRGKVLAVVGCGAIGRSVARIASAGFGMRVVGCYRSAHGAPELRSDSGFEALTNDFEAAVLEADFITLHIPAAPENSQFINRERLAMIRRDAWIVNTARGAVIDETALYDALAERRIGGAALDVFQREPYEPADPARDLRTLPNTILTPHVGSNTAEANARMAARALQNITYAIAGTVDRMDLLNSEVLAG